MEQRWRWNHSEDLTSAGHNNYQQLNIFTWRKLNNFIREYSAPQHQICSLSLLCASTAQGKFHLEVSACAVRSYRPVLPWCSLSLSHFSCRLYWAAHSFQLELNLPWAPGEETLSSNSHLARPPRCLLSPALQTPAWPLPTNTWEQRKFSTENNHPDSR